MKKYVAHKKLKVKRRDRYVMLEPGDPIPEAEFWPHLRVWVKFGYVRIIETNDENKSFKTPLPALSVRKEEGAKKHYASERKTSSDHKPRKARKMRRERDK